MGIVTEELLEEAKNLAAVTFDPKRLNASAVVAVKGDDEALLLIGWDDEASSWIVESPSRGQRHVNAVADACEMKGFVDFCLGIRGRLIRPAGDFGPADEAARFDRFQRAGGVLGKYQHLLLAGQ
jgi:hypothetical protein